MNKNTRIFIVTIIILVVMTILLTHSAAIERDKLYGTQSPTRSDKEMITLILNF